METINFVGITPQTHITETAKEVRNVLLPEIQNLIGENQQNKYYSADKICELLGITKPTLHEWRKRNIIKTYKIGSRVYYRWDEIEKAMIIND